MCPSPTIKSVPGNLLVTGFASYLNCSLRNLVEYGLLLGVGVISHQLVRIHINAGRRWFWENTHQRGNYTSEQLNTM